MLALDIGLLIGGIVVIETVFAYPGLGRLLVFSIQSRDIPTLQAAILVVTAVYALANLVADLLYAWLNPSIRYGSSRRLRRPARARARPWPLRSGPASLIVGAIVRRWRLLAPWIAPHPWDTISMRTRFQPPNATYWLGTDEYGRDVLSRLLIGAQLSLAMGFGATLFSLADRRAARARRRLLPRLGRRGAHARRRRADGHPRRSCWGCWCWP